MMIFIIFYFSGCIITLLFLFILFIGIVIYDANDKLENEKKYCKNNRKLLPKHELWNLTKYNIINWRKNYTIISNSIYYTPLMSFGGIFYLIGMYVALDNCKKNN